MAWAEKIFACLRDNCYKASAMLAKEKGAFPL
jgi:ribonucleotide reductase alpha subunit